MAKIVPLSTEEAARTGCTHLINYRFDDARGDAAGTMATTLAIENVTAVPIGTIISKVILNCKTAFTNGTLNKITMGTANTVTAGTNILSADVTPATANLAVIANIAVVVSTASQFITIQNSGTGTAAGAGECNIYLHIMDSTLGRSTFA